MRPALPITAVLLHTLPASAITIELDYSLDSNGFFDQPGSRTALRAVADLFESVLTDQLAAIVPSGGNTWSIEFFHPATDAPVSIPNPSIPADTLRIYAGGMEIPGTTVGIGGFGGWSGSAVDGTWLDTIQKRGAPDGGTIIGSDFTPWGGTITFDTTVSWNFSLTSADDPATPFVTIAMHELSHTLGIGTSGAWERLVDRGNSTFTGPRATASYGAPVPVEPDLGHFRDDRLCSSSFQDGFDPDNLRNTLSSTLPVFGTPAGRPQIALMDPSNCTVGPYHKVLTEVDLAALDDIGWDVDYAALTPSAAPVLSAALDPDTGSVTVS